MVRSLIPCFFANCRPHVIRAACRWIKASKRQAAIRNQLKAFMRLTYRLFSSGSGMLSVCETVVALGFVKYIVSQQKLNVDRVQILSKASSCNRSQVEEITRSCTSFLNKQIKSIQNILSTMFLEIKQSSSTLSVE